MHPLVINDSCEQGQRGRLRAPSPPDGSAVTAGPSSSSRLMRRSIDRITFMRCKMCPFVPLSSAAVLGCRASASPPRSCCRAALSSEPAGAGSRLPKLSASCAIFAPPSW
eukprot:scaffold36097_cov73-Phaeocystis_antarctica.AAC.5